MADVTTGDDLNNENIELEEITQIEESEGTGEEETNLDEDDELERLEMIKQSLRKGGEDQAQLGRLQRLRDPNASIVVPQGLNPDIEAEQEVRELEQKKDFLREYLNISVDESDGTNSAKFLKHTELRVGKTGKIIGLRWKGKDVIVSAKDGYDYTDAKKHKSAVDDFKAFLARAQIEHGKTAAAEVEEQFVDTGVSNATREDVAQVLRSVDSQTEDRFEELKDEVLEVRRGGLTKAEVDALIGVLSFDRTQKMTPEEQIKFLSEAELPHWREKLKEAKKEDKNSVRTKQITDVVEIMELKADMHRIRNNIKPETCLVKKLIRTEARIGDISRLRRFTNWAKENLLALSAVAISAAGIITTVVIAGRGAVKAGARATKRFSKGLAKVAEKVAPVLGTVLNLVGNVLKLGVKGLDWLSRNLWLLALLFAYLAYDKLLKKKHK